MNPLFLEVLSVSPVASPDGSPPAVLALPVGLASLVRLGVDGTTGYATVFVLGSQGGPLGAGSGYLKTYETVAAIVGRLSANSPTGLLLRASDADRTAATDNRQALVGSSS